MNTTIWKLLALVLILLNSSSVKAQINISGKVVNDQGSGQFYAHVVLHSAQDTSVLAGTVADEEGHYQIEYFEGGTFIISTQMLGFYDTYSDKIQIKNGDKISMPDLVLSENTTQLEEVQIVEQRALFEQKIDRLVVNVDDRVSTAGSSALDVLKKSPGIIVNPQSGVINMNGKSGVIVMIDGKISRLSMDAVVQMLEGMSADNIEKIELIHTPPANYDAQANAGFINIVLKQGQDEGLNGGYSVNAGIGKKEKIGAAVDMNYRKNKINLYSDFSWRHNDNPQTTKNYRSFQLNDIFYESDAYSDRDPTLVQTYNVRVGMDVEAGDKTIFGFLGSYFDRHWTMDALNDVSYFEDEELQERILIPNDEINDRRQILANINLDHQFNDRQRLNLDFDYLYIFSDNPSNYTNQFYDSNDVLFKESKLRVSKETPMDIFVFKADYSQQLNEQWKIDLGMKGTSIAFENEILIESLIQDEWVTDPLFSSLANLDERIAAAYTTLSYQKNGFGLNFGLRYEFTDTKLGTVENPDIVNRQFGQWFPSVFMTKSLTEKTSLQLSYRRGIQRPGFWDLAPFFIFWDPSTVLTGNPTLLNSVNNDFRLSYNLNTIQLSAQYSYTTDPIARWQPQVDLQNNTQVVGAKNYQNAKLINAGVSFPLQLTDWWELRSSWTVVWTKVNADEQSPGLSFEESSWFMNGSSNLDLGKGFSLEISGSYFSPSIAGSVIWDSFNNVDVGLQKSFTNGAKLSFNVQDLLIGGNFRGTTNAEDLGFNYVGEYNFSERVFRLSYSHRFGNNKLKKARERQTGAAEEIQRGN